MAQEDYKRLIIIIKDIINSNIKFEFHYLNNTSIDTYAALILFLSNKNPHKVKIYQPFYLYSPIINSIEFIEHELFNSNLYKGGSNMFLEHISHLSFCILGEIGSKHYWNKLLHKISCLISKDSRSKSIENDIKISSRYIRFLVSDVDEIKTYDIQEGLIENGFKVKNKRCYILFKPFIIYNNENIYLVNQINSLLYV